MKSPRFKWPSAHSLARADDDRTVALLGRNVVVADVRERVRLSTSHPLSHPSEASFSPDGRLLAVKSTSGKIVVIDPTTGAAVADFKNQKEGEGSGAYFSPDGNQIIDGSWAGFLTVRSSSSGDIVLRHHFAGESLCTISHDRERRTWLVEHSAIVRPGENWPRPGYVALYKWPLLGGKGKAFAFNMRIEGAKISPDGTRFCFFETKVDRRVHVARVSDGEIMASSLPIKFGGTGNDLSWSNDGMHIAAVGDDQFLFLKASDLSITGSANLQFPSGALFMQDDQEIVLGSWKSATSIKREAAFTK